METPVQPALNASGQPATKDPTFPLLKKPVELIAHVGEFRVVCIPPEFHKKAWEDKRPGDKKPLNHSFN